MIKVSFDSTEAMNSLRNLEDDIKNAISRAVYDAVYAAEASAKSTSLYEDRTGTLRRETYGRDIGSTSGKLIANTKYSYYVENGRKAIPKPRYKQFMRFEIAGTVLFRRSVGPASPRPFMQLAGVIGGQVLSRQVDKYVDEAVKQHNG